MEKVRGTLRSGDLPLWNPNIEAGRPLLASQQLAPFYPLNLLADVLPFWQALGVIAVAKLVLAAFGTDLF